MNCEKAKRKIWLAESGELTARDGDELAAHLASCAPCARRRDAAFHDLSVVRNELPDGAPGDAVRARIRAAAVERAGTRHSFVGRVSFVRVMAYAATLAALIGVWFLLSGATHADRVEEMRVILAMVSEDEAGGMTEIEADTAAGAEQDRGLNRLARQLLIIQGLAVDDLTEPEQPIPDEPSSPTALQWHSTPVSRSQKCV